MVILGFTTIIILCLGFVWFNKSRSESHKIKTKKEQIKELQSTINQLTEMKNSINQTIDELKEQALKDQISLKEEYKEKLEEVKAEYKRKRQQELDKYTEECNSNTVKLHSLQQDFQRQLIELQNDFQEKSEGIKNQYSQLESQMKDMRNCVQAAQAAHKREEEIRESAKKYTLNISDENLQEIHILRSVIPQLRNKRPICKIIWESFYRDETNSLVNRLGANGVTGIYKITNTQNGRVYIGQSVNIGDRFKQHIKCGLGIDAPQNNLYRAMQKIGLENFTFEVLETCARDKLNDKEKYWIDFYDSYNYGLNMTKGGS